MENDHQPSICWLPHVHGSCQNWGSTMYSHSKKKMFERHFCVYSFDTWIGSIMWLAIWARWEDERIMKGIWIIWTWYKVRSTKQCMEIDWQSVGSSNTSSIIPRESPQRTFLAKAKKDIWHIRLLQETSWCHCSANVSQHQAICWTAWPLKTNNP